MSDQTPDSQKAAVLPESAPPETSISLPPLNSLAVSATPIQTAPSQRPPNSFCFILSPLDVKCEWPIEVIPGFFLQRANDEQILAIKDKIKLFEPFGFFATRYEADLTHSDETLKPHSPNTPYQSLPSEKWRYWILTFRGSNTEYHRSRYGGGSFEKRLPFRIYLHAIWSRLGLWLESLFRIQLLPFPRRRGHCNFIC